MVFNPVDNPDDLMFARETLAKVIRGRLEVIMPWNDPEVSTEIEDLPGGVKKVSAYAKVDAPAICANPGLARIALHVANRGMMAKMIESLPFDSLKDGLFKIASEPQEMLTSESDDPIFDNVCVLCEEMAEKTGAIEDWPEMMADLTVDGLPIEYGIYASVTFSPWTQPGEEMEIRQGFSIDAPWFIEGESMDAGLRSQKAWLLDYLGKRA